MTDLHGIRPVGGPVVGPSYIAGQHSLRPLQPFKADECRSAEVWFPEVLERIR